LHVVAAGNSGSVPEEKRIYYGQKKRLANLWNRRKITNKAHVGRGQELKSKIMPSIHNRGEIKMKFIIPVTCLMLLSLCGCVSTLIGEKVASTATPPHVANSNFDLSTPGADAGKLTVQFRQPTYQLAVEKYAVKIDSLSPLVVSKQSDVEVKLDAGKHSLKFYAVSSNPAESEKVSYGEPTKREIVIIKDQEQKLKYTGPYRLFGRGDVEVIQ
jgi:hypothetical protein